MFCTISTPSLDSQNSSNGAEHASKPRQISRSSTGANNRHTGSRGGVSRRRRPGGVEAGSSVVDGDVSSGGGLGVSLSGPDRLGVLRASGSRGLSRLGDRQANGALDRDGMVLGVDRSLGRALRGDSRNLGDNSGHRVRLVGDDVRILAVGGDCDGLIGGVVGSGVDGDSRVRSLGGGASRLGRRLALG